MRHLMLISALALAACHPAPDEVALKIVGAIEQGSPENAMALVHAAYADPRGDRAQLAADLEDFRQSFPRIRLDLSDLTVVEGLTAKTSQVVGTLDGELVGAPTWRVKGPARLTFEMEGGPRLVSGLLHDLRDVRALAAARRAALEANDPEGLRPLLHPAYRDGDTDADEAIARLKALLANTSVRIEVTNYRLEVRGPIAHLDEHYRIEVAGRPLAPQIARLTLAPSAGRWRIRGGLFGDRD